MALRAIVSDIRCLGAAQAMSKARDGFRRHELIVLRKGLDEIAPIAFAQRLEVAEIGPDDLRDLAVFNRRRCDSRATGRFAADRARGYGGFVARLDGEVGGFYWWSDHDHPHVDALGIRLADGDVYGFDFYLAPEHRGGAHATEFLHGIETRLRDRGYDRVWGYVRSDNRPARWLYAMRGYESVGEVHLRLGRMR